MNYMPIRGVFYDVGLGICSTFQLASTKLNLTSYGNWRMGEEDILFSYIFMFSKRILQNSL